MTDKFTFESLNTRRNAINSLPILRTEVTKVETESIEKLSNDQKEVFDNIEKIRASANSNYSIKKKDEMFDGATLLKYLNYFGKYPKNMKKKDIVKELENIYAKYTNKSIEETEKEEKVKVAASSSKKSKYDDFM